MRGRLVFLCFLAVLVSLSVEGRSLFSKMGGIGNGTPAGVACDQGPNYTGLVPGPATAAGFTHCAVNADFTTATTDGNGINYSNTATWITECGATSPAFRFRLSYDFGPNGTPAQPLAPCGRATIMADPDTSDPQVLRLQYTLSDQSCWLADGCGRWLSFAWPTIYAGLPTTIPNEMYAEVEFRFPPNSVVVTSGEAALSVDIWELGWTPFIDSSSPMQFESRTACTSPCSTFQAGWTMKSDYHSMHQESYYVSGVDGSTGPYWSGWDAYHKWGILVTSDELTIQGLCTYRDNSFEGCQAINLPSGSLGYTQRTQSLVMWIGGGNCYHEPPPNAGGCIVNDVNMYVKSFRIWTCPGYLTGTCPGPVILSKLESGTSFAWLRDIGGKVLSWLVPAAAAEPIHADPFDGHLYGRWTCPDGSVSDWGFAACMPRDLQGVRFWEACVPGHPDCQLSPTAFIGRDELKAKRGMGYCYTDHPYTCSPDGKLH